MRKAASWCPDPRRERRHRRAPRMLSGNPLARPVLDTGHRTSQRDVPCELAIPPRINGRSRTLRTIARKVRNWRAGWDLNPRDPCGSAGFRNRCDRPLCHLPIKTQYRCGRNWCGRRVSNPRHSRCKRDALPSELQPRCGWSRDENRADNKVRTCAPKLATRCSTAEPWSSERSAVPAEGIEPTTFALRMRRTTAVLHRRLVSDPGIEPGRVASTELQSAASPLRRVTRCGKWCAVEGQVLLHARRGSNPSVRRLERLCTWRATAVRATSTSRPFRGSIPVPGGAAHRAAPPGLPVLSGPSSRHPQMAFREPPGAAMRRRG